MGRNFAPPLDDKAIRLARLHGGMTQAEVAGRVAQLVAADGIKFDRSGLSLIENGNVKRPHPKVIRALSQVLGLDPGAVFKDGGGEDEDDEPETAAA
jgi:transcriptional regulator with XRE-family HTH domain